MQTPPLHKEAWHRTKGWYRDEFDRGLPPAQVTIERIMAECVDLYHCVPPPGENIPVPVEPLQIEDLLPTEDEIEWAVKRLSNHRSREPSEMRAEHLKGWLEEVRKKGSEAAKSAAAERTREMI